MRTPYTIVFDLETGGVETHHPSIQLAAIAVDDEWREVSSFEQKIIFDEADCDPEALALNHYTPEAWAEAASPNACSNLFSRWLAPYRSVTLVSKRTGKPYSVAAMAGYNVAFDQPRLKALYSNSFMPCHYLMRCVLQRVIWYYEESGNTPPDSYKLSNVARELGLDPSGAHDALADVRLTAAVYRSLHWLW